MTVGTLMTDLTVGTNGTVRTAVIKKTLVTDLTVGLLGHGTVRTAVIMTEGTLETRFDSRD